MSLTQSQTSKTDFLVLRPIFFGADIRMFCKLSCMLNWSRCKDILYVALV